MKNGIITSIVYLSLLTLLTACASSEVVMAPDTQDGDLLKHEYLVGKWCTNRELTSVANSEAGFSALLNISKEFWKFTDDGKWQSAESGWIYSALGEWQLEGPDTVILKRKQGNTFSYQARFRSSGVDLYLKDKEGQFLVLSRCD